MKFCEFAGKPFEIGEQCGRAFGPWIEASIAGLCPQHGHFATPQQVDERTTKTVEEHRRYFPEYIQELEGIAKGSGLRFLDVACLALRVYHRFDPARPECEEHCYVVGVEDAQEGPVLGGVLEDFAFFSTIQKIKPTYGYKLIQLVWPGTHWTRGINEHGLCITGASAEAGKLKPGGKGFKPKGDRMIPLSYMMLLKCRTVKEAIAFAEPFEMVGNQGLADATGEMVLLECVKGYRAVRRPEDRMMIATSFFKTPDMLKALKDAGHDHEWAINFFGGGAGKERYQIVERLLKASEGKSPEARLKEVFTCHEGSAMAVPCSSGNVNSAIFYPRRKTCLAAGRFACSSPWIEYGF